jgi:hypothetical protein
MLGLAAAVLLLAILNWIYQVARKPSELLFPVSGVLYKSPAETWRTYGPLFRMHSTAIMTPELLAALAQTEGSGNPVARTYWRWRMSSRPFDLYRPASSAVGMYQITNGTFGIARRYCIHGHRVVADGPWDDFHSCWFNALYTRTLPSDAVELTSAYLTKAVGDILLRNGRRTPRLEQQRQLAVLIHLCGAGAGELYARRGLHLAPGQRCGDHSARDYLERVLAMQRTFVSIARRNPSAAGV